MHVLLIAGLLLVQAASAEPVVFKDAKIRMNRSEKDRRLVDKGADLRFDDSAKQLTVTSEGKSQQIGYDDVTKVVFDVTTHMRGGAFGQLMGGVSGALIQGKHVNDYWFYLEKKDGSRTVLEVAKESAPAVIEKAKTAFGDRVTEYATKQGEKLEKETLKDLQSKHSLNRDKKQHPIPEIKPGQALVVVVCPAPSARQSGKGNQFKLHANDKVIAVNKPGSYSFAYLDPGEYQLAAQAENANGFRMQLEAGKEYYFLQNIFMGAFKARTSLSQQSKEIVLHEMSGAEYSDWERK
jgi:hypothetical protein